ncbi:hypothetical protein [Paracerasibacillus soli]|uniref:Uncharacterized protein n=1 Tax=Paracerasibacillus soli TaxID=480284 RepID=A0ABU5CVC1_9BACI|nr:hypothetical protein [Virgibacillus soli]MDY0409390.1 hypothetical protein [Virgibacillus soli]
MRVVEDSHSIVEDCGARGRRFTFYGRRRGVRGRRFAFDCRRLRCAW